MITSLAYMQQKHTAEIMPVRIALLEDEPVFRNQLAAALRDAGHEVLAFGRCIKAWAPSHVDRKTEILISRTQDGYLGVRIQVTSVPTTEKYTGGWSTVVAEPVTAAAVVVALRNLLPDTSLNLGDIIPREENRRSQQHTLYLAEAAKYRSWAENTPANVTATDAVLANGYEILARSFAQLSRELGSA
jgi:hypothetical protein